MKYLEAVIWESMRLFPLFARIERRAVQQCQLGETGINIPKDIIISMPIYSIHRDPEQFPEPDQYKPERFLTESRDQKTAFFPFGDGPRGCIAMRLGLMQTKLAIFNTIKNYKLSVSPITKVKNVLVSFQFLVKLIMF